MAPPFPRAGPGVPPVAIALRFGAGSAKAAPTRRSVRRFGEMAPPFPRASPGVPPVAMALRLGAGPAKAAPTRRSVRRIFPAAHVAGKNDFSSFRLAPETRKGFPLPGLFPGGRGTGVPGRLPAAMGSACCPARREAALPAGDFYPNFADFGDFGAILPLRERKNGSPHAFPPPFRGLCPAAGRGLSCAYVRFSNGTPLAISSGVYHFY